VSPVSAYPFERWLLRLLNSQRARDGRLCRCLCREPAIPDRVRPYSLRFRAPIGGANGLLVIHVRGLLPENLRRYILPVPTAARTVSGNRLHRQDFYGRQDDFSAPFTLNYVAHDGIGLAPCRSAEEFVSRGRALWSVRPRSLESQPSLVMSPRRETAPPLLLVGF
jgi:hypothetical protein